MNRRQFAMGVAALPLVGFTPAAALDTKSDMPALTPSMQIRSHVGDDYYIFSFEAASEIVDCLSYVSARSDLHVSSRGTLEGYSDTFNAVIRMELHDAVTDEFIGKFAYIYHTKDRVYLTFPVLPLTSSPEYDTM